MADIFISYPKADQELALKLSAFLESEGWSVWWDKSLGAGDSYRDEIMKQLASARAVIVIWTENRIKSDWVRTERHRIYEPKKFYAGLVASCCSTSLSESGQTEITSQAVPAMTNAAPIIP
jgi:hypothetical protein